jgi:hypothetical protein
LIMSDATHTMLYSAKRHFFLVLVFALLGLSSTALAATGTIDSTKKYAWSNIGGWVNFAATMSTVTVSDTALTGYVWSANNGWINLSPTDGGVLNDGSGNLSGDAWDETSGWISFEGVTIDADGYFNGQAAGENGYVLNFDCGNCSVRTDWRAATSEVTPDSSSTSGSRSRADTLTSTQELPPAGSPEGIEPAIVPVRSPNYPPEGDVILIPPTQLTNATETPSTSVPVSSESEVEDELLTITPQPSAESVNPMLDIKFLIPLSFFLLLLIIGIILYARQYRSE